MVNEILEALLALQSLQSEESAPEKMSAARLRARVPAQILAHFDRLQARGKKGVAIVRHGVCSGCHMQLPTGAIATLLHGSDLQICDTCGRYLALEKELVPAVEPAPSDVPPKSSAKKGRKRVVTHAQ